MQHVSIERRPPLRLARLDTGKRNVLTLEAVTALQRAIAADAEAPVLVLSGRSDGFCAGLDNATLARSAAHREELLAAMGRLLLSAITGPTRIVTACAGHAVAAGAMLLLVADARVGARGRYKIGFTEPGLGMPLPELPTLLARERLDRRRLYEHTVLGRTVDPQAAAAVGFLDEVVAGDDLEPVALERAVAIAGLSDAAYRGSLASFWAPSIGRLRALVDEQERRHSRSRAG